MIENPEIQAKVLEWQRRYNIPDGDPAMALLELLNIYGYRGGTGAGSGQPRPCRRGSTRSRRSDFPCGSG
jgi:hypothetical protein